MPIPTCLFPKCVFVIFYGLKRKSFFILMFTGRALTHIQLFQQLPEKEITGLYLQYINVTEAFPTLVSFFIEVKTTLQLFTPNFSNIILLLLQSLQSLHVEKSVTISLYCENFQLINQFTHSPVFRLFFFLLSPM